MKLENLFEASKSEYVVNTFGQKLEKAAETLERKRMSAEEIVKKLEEADPTPNKMYLVWIALQYASMKFRLEDTSRLNGDLKKFDNLKAKLPNKDIMKYSLEDLYDVIEQNEEVDIRSARQVSKEIKNKGAEKIIDDENFTVLHLKNKEAACYYGKGTKWCTAGDENNQFDNYANQGPLYVILVNDNGKQRKFQMHVESSQFMDERDQQVKQSDINLLSRFPGYLRFLNMLIEKNYTKFLKYLD
jgi:hypothetical protein